MTNSLLAVDGTHPSVIVDIIQVNINMIGYNISQCHSIFFNAIPCTSMPCNDLQCQSFQFGEECRVVCWLCNGPRGATNLWLLHNTMTIGVTTKVFDCLPSSTTGLTFGWVTLSHLATLILIAILEANDGRYNLTQFAKCIACKFFLVCLPLCPQSNPNAKVSDDTHENHTSCLLVCARESMPKGFSSSLHTTSSSGLEAKAKQTHSSTTLHLVLSTRYLAN